MNKKALIPAIVTLAALLAFVLGAGVATEIRAQGDDSSVIHACVHNKSGNVRIVDPDEPCKKNWTAIRLAAITEVGDATVPGDLQVQGGKLTVGTSSITIDDSDDSITASSGEISFGNNDLITTGNVNANVVVGETTDNAASAIQGVHSGEGNSVAAVLGRNEGGGIGVQGWADGGKPAVEGVHFGNGVGVRGWTDGEGQAVEGINEGGGVGVLGWADGPDNPAIEAVHAGNSSAIFARTGTDMDVDAPTIHARNEGGGVGVQGWADGRDAGVEGSNAGSGPGVAGIGLGEPSIPAKPGEGVGVVAVSQHSPNIIEAYDGEGMPDPVPPLLTWVHLRFSVERESGDVYVGGILHGGGSYIQIPAIEGEPDLNDCDEEAEAGRIVVRTDGTANLYICTGLGGWVGK